MLHIENSQLLKMVLLIGLISCTYAMYQDNYESYDAPDFGRPEGNSQLSYNDRSGDGEIAVERRGYGSFLSKHKGFIPYYYFRDGINYGGRPGAASTRSFGGRTYGMSRLRPSRYMSIKSRSSPYGIYK